MTAPASYGPLVPVRLSEVKPGDGLTFGNHTGWYRVRRVTRVEVHGIRLVTVHSWWRRRVIASADRWVWVRRG